MGFIFNFLGSIFGYLLWFFFDAVSNYIGAITLFVLVVNIAMIPLAIKRQKSSAKTSKLAVKQRELKKKYEKNQKKYNEELAKLYEQEGANPMSGCISTMILPLILWGGIIGAINRPLQNTLHIPQEKISQAVKVLSEDSSIPVRGGYEELQIIKNFSGIKDKLTMFNKDEIDDIEEYSSGFNFMGINLLGKPNESDFSEMLWIIPLLCFVVSAATMYLTQKISGNSVEGPGCAKFMPYTAIFFIAWVAYTVPAAVGVYWVLNSFFGMIQSLFLSKYYNNYTIGAKEEAARFALLELQESKIKKIK